MSLDLITRKESRRRPNSLSTACRNRNDAQKGEKKTRARRDRPRARSHSHNVVAWKEPPPTSLTESKRGRAGPPRTGKRHATSPSTVIDKSDLAGRLTYHARDPSTPLDSATFDPPVSSICFFVSAFWKTVYNK